MSATVTLPDPATVTTPAVKVLEAPVSPIVVLGIRVPRENVPDEPRRALDVEGTRVPAAEVPACPKSGLEFEGGRVPAVNVAACPVRANVSPPPPPASKKIAMTLTRASALACVLVTVCEAVVVMRL